jgi:hypothetical protein
MVTIIEIYSVKPKSCVDPFGPPQRYEEGTASKWAHGLAVGAKVHFKQVGGNVKLQYGEKVPYYMCSLIQPPIQTSI